MNAIKFRYMMFSCGFIVSAALAVLWVPSLVAAQGKQAAGSAAQARAQAGYALQPAPLTVPAPCDTSLDYVIGQSTGVSLVPGTVDTGLHCSECDTTLNLPFPYTFYDRVFTTAVVTSKGTLGFIGVTGAYWNNCLPDIYSNYAIFPHWDDLDVSSTCGSGNCGIYTSVSGKAPNRIFNIEWRARYHNQWDTANFEVRLYEGQMRFDLVYGDVTMLGQSATIGAQKGTGSQSTQFACGTSALNPGVQLAFIMPPCGSTPTPVPPTPTDTPTYTPAPPTATVPPTGTRTSTPTCVPGSSNYVAAVSQGTIDPGTDMIPGSHCNNCTNTISLPFTFSLYDRKFSSAIVGSNGVLGFVSNSNPGTPVCMPSSSFDYAIVPDWEQLTYRYSNDAPGAPAVTLGVYTSITGAAPDRIFNIEWRANDYFNVSPVNMEVRLYENAPNKQFDVVYATVNHHGGHATVGVQKGTGSQFTQFSCLTQGRIGPGVKLTFSLQPCMIPHMPPPATSPGNRP